MLLARRNNNSDWLSNFFDDAFFNTELMPRMNATAPAINVKETEKAYQMEIAAPGFKSVSNFIAAFKKYTGMTPSLYQKLSKNG